MLIHQISLLTRTYNYRLKHNPECTLDEIIEDARHHIVSKFGSNGYAINKMYFKDEDYEKMLSEIEELTNNKELFRQRMIDINHIKVKKI